MIMDTPLFDIHLINGNITLFIGAHTEPFKKDILNSSLLGELASISKQSNSKELLWADYVDTVGKIGWIIKSREFKRQEFPTKCLLKIVELGMGSLLSKEEKQTLATAFSQLKKTEGHSSAIKSFLDKLHTNAFVANEETTAPGSTQSPVATSTRLTLITHNASIITLQVAFKTRDGIGIDILDQPLLDTIKDGNTNLWLMVSSLDARQYENVRATVIKKIGNRINTDLLQVAKSACPV
ncbi:hypothetical protein [Pseudomonas sp. NPDC089569]|uniref:hypothetical protein n=1 Tax=Pseudomonas sp. NPDC089569 TaxID=3390722 RepID=UPI003D016C94